MKTGKQENIADIFGFGRGIRKRRDSKKSVLLKRFMSKFNFWDWKKYPQFTGTFTGQYAKVGQFQRNVFCFSTEDGAFSSWDYVQLKKLLYGVPFGTKLKITYLGLQPMPDKPTNKFMAFNVEIIGAPKKGREIEKKKEE